AMQQMSTPILFLFTLFPVLAITKQFGRMWGGIAGVLELALVVMTMKLWPNMFAGALAMAVGVLMLIGLAVSKDLRQRRADRAAGAVEEEVGGDDPMASLFSASATRLRKYLPLFMLLGAGVCVLAQMHVFGGGEATSFLIAKGQYAEAAQVDFYRVFGFIPLIATTALASGAYGIAGFTLVYPIGY
ncbi:permease, partial [Streptomyces sp. SID7499]|nr:permease [Streptomyces sp. SID7499]